VEGGVAVVEAGTGDLCNPWSGDGIFRVIFDEYIQFAGGPS
jgi:hypothetical protein